MDSLSGAIYDEIDQEMSIHHQHETWSDMASRFYEDNRSTYTAPRGESLSKLPDLNPDLWKTHLGEAAVRQEMNLVFLKRKRNSRSPDFRDIPKA